MLKPYTTAVAVWCTAVCVRYVLELRKTTYVCGP